MVFAAVRAVANAFLLSLLVTPSTIAASVTFRVVSPQGTPALSVNGGAPQAMKQFTQSATGAQVAGAPYYTITVDAPEGAFKYKYSVDTAAEDFDRDFPAKASQTFNDFFGRQATVSKLPNLPLAFGTTWPRGWGLTPAFDDSYFPTIFLAGDQAQIDALLAATTTAATVTMLAVFKDEALVYPSTTWKIDGLDRRIVYAKRDFKLKLPQKVNLYGRDDWLLRATITDPTALREMTYTALLAAAGLPAPRMNYVRVYVNQVPLGLYLLADDASSNSFLRAEFHGQRDYKSNAVIGSLVRGEDPFYFIYNGSQRVDYPEVSVQYLGHNPVTNTLQTFITRWVEPLNMLNPGDEAALEKILAPNVDIDLLLKTVAVEWIAGCLRGVWGASDRFVLYEPVRQRWSYISSDARESFGVGFTSDVLPLASISESFAVYQVQKARPVVQKIISSKSYFDKLSGYISALVQRVFNEPHLVARIQAHAARLRPEVEWDRSLTRPSTGMPDLYGIADFDSGLTATAERVWNTSNSTNTPNIPGVGFGLVTFVQQRSTAVASLLNVQPDASLSGPDPIVTSPSADQLEDTALLSVAARCPPAILAGLTGCAAVVIAALGVRGAW